MIKVDSRYFRPTEVEQLLGNPSKAFDKLRVDSKNKFGRINNQMINFDRTEAKKEYLLKTKGFDVIGPKE